jgi:malonyl-CoA/methylmalonyl-CoA synthetase
MDIVRRCARFARNPAVKRKGEDVVLHGDLFSRALRVRRAVLDEVTDGRLQSGNTIPVAVATESLSSYPCALFGSWLAGTMAVPVVPSHPDPVIGHVLQDSRPAVILCDDSHAERMRSLSLSASPDTRIVSLDRELAGSRDLESDWERDWERELESSNLINSNEACLLLYTSGTTGKPKGVVHTHGSLGAQVESLRVAWKFSPTDRVLHCLPLHHIHGIVNALLLPLYAGASVVDSRPFSVRGVFEALQQRQANVFMGVPTMYSYLLKHIADCESETERQRAIESVRSVPLWISGSSGMPLRVMEEWKRMSGVFPLERYGMTEVGMALSNPIETSRRRPGTVGVCLPGMEVEVREEGELFCRGPQLFSEYWGLPEVTEQNFDDSGWFRTGDAAELDADGFVKLRGRLSSDFIKSKGYRISALEIESALLHHESVEEVCVLGVPDDLEGEKLVAFVSSEEEGLENTLRGWCLERLPAHQVPSTFVLLEHLPRNLMGKVDKKQLRRYIETIRCRRA